MRKVMCCLTSVMVVVMLMGFSIGVVQAGNCVPPAFDDDNFTYPYPTDNPYLPVSVIGTTFVYEVEEDEDLIRNYVHYSVDTVNILGVVCMVVYDVEWIWVQELNGGAGDWRQLEYTEDWHAWDDFGAFWYFGEDTEEYFYDDNWDPTPPFVSDEGSWIAGFTDSEGNTYQPGIILPADPQPGDCEPQEYAPEVAEDVGKVLRLNASCEYPVENESEECMVMKEWTALEPGNVEHKVYFPDVGLVYIKELKEKTVEVELVEINNDANTGITTTPPSF